MISAFRVPFLTIIHQLRVQKPISEFDRWKGEGRKIVFAVWDNIGSHVETVITRPFFADAESDHEIGVAAIGRGQRTVAVLGNI